MQKGTHGLSKGTLPMKVMFLVQTARGFSSIHRSDDRSSSSRIWKVGRFVPVHRWG